MGNKLAAVVVVALVAFTLALGLVLGVRSALEAPAVVGALAEQEQARADALRAQAAQAWAAAARAESDARSWVASEDARALSLELAAYGLALALVVLTVGLALVAVGWAQRRAAVLYPNERGAWPVLIERRRNGALVVLDAGRLVGPALVIRADNGMSAPMLASEPAQVAISSGALAAATVGAAAVASGQREQLAGLVGQLAEGLRPHGGTPGLQLAPGFASDKGQAPRFVYVKQPRGNTQAERELADLREFILGAEVRGLSRRAWLGYKFKSGHECTRSRFDDLVSKLKRSGVVVAEGQGVRLVVPVAEALDAFGLGELDGQAAEDERELA